MVPCPPLAVSPPTEYLTLAGGYEGHGGLHGAAEVDEDDFTLEGAVTGSGTVTFEQRCAQRLAAKCCCPLLLPAAPADPPPCRCGLATPGVTCAGV